MKKCFWCILFTLRFGSEAHTSSLIKKGIGFSKKNGNAHVVLNFVCPTNELKAYSNKPVKPSEIFSKAATRGVLQKKVFLKIFQNSQETPLPESLF